MKKILVALMLFIVFFVGSLAGVLFTNAGNSLLKKVIEKRLNDQLPVTVTFEKFSLFPLDIGLHIANDSSVNLKGDVNLFDQTMDLTYQIDIKDLSELEKLTHLKVRGPLKASGLVQGHLEKFQIIGKSDLAKSQMKYSLDMEVFEPKSLNATIKSASLPKLLYMFYQPPFLNGELNLDANLPELDPKNLQGNMRIEIEKAAVVSSVMKKEFGVDLPSTKLESIAIVKLLGDHIALNTLLNSNLLHFQLQGEIAPEPLHTNGTYSAKIAKLELLKPITHADIRGELNVEGSIKGSKDKMIIDGKSDIAQSKTDFRLTLHNFTPAKLSATIVDAKLAKLLYMLKQPIYADGVIKSDIELSSLDPKNIRGRITSRITKGRTNPLVLKKEFGFDGALIRFNVDQRSKIAHSIATSEIVADTSVAKFHIQKSQFDIRSGKVDADYSLFVPDLDKLYFLTKRHMRGKITVLGKLQKDQNLKVTAHSSTLGGKVDVELLNNDLKAQAKEIKLTKLTDMLLLNRVFSSTVDATLTYNLLNKKGKFNAIAHNGRILPNQMSLLLSQIAKFDITKEIYTKTTLKSDINNNLITSDLDMVSRLTHITSKDALVDLKRERINAKLKIEIKGKPVYVKLKGKLDAPKVIINASSIVRERAKRVIEKKLKKRFGDRLPDAAKSILNLF